MRSPRREPTRQDRFEATVLVHLDAAYNLARWLLRDDSGAEDVVQDASLRAFRFFETMQGPSPKAWFIAIVRNACLDWIGARKRRGVEEAFDEAEHGSAMSDAGDSPNRRRPLPCGPAKRGTCMHASMRCPSSSAKC